MTEKDIREAARRVLRDGTSVIWDSEWSGGTSPTEQLTKAMADDPDAVAALRILAETAREHEKLMDDEAQDWNAGYEYGFYDAAVSLAFEIEKAQHVRLTDDGGYEWTD